MFTRIHQLWYTIRVNHAYDNIGNRKTAQEVTEEITQYNANQLNQYTAIDEFVPTYDADGNQTRIQTQTGIWNVSYNALNRPVLFTSSNETATVECAYDYMGRRATKKVTVNGEVTLHQRYIYRGYLQIACVDLTRSAHPCLWLILWNPTQPIATRPLAIQKDGTWYTYGWDLTKNICEVYGPAGYIRTTYDYPPFGSVTANGDVTQPIQWSSEYADEELDLIYYNYRHYSPRDGRWINRDLIGERDENNLYNYIKNKLFSRIDVKGLSLDDKCEFDICGPDVTDWLIDTMNANLKSHVVRVMKENQWALDILAFNLGWVIAHLAEFKRMVQTNEPWDFKNSVSFQNAHCNSQTPACKHSVTLCGYCTSIENIGNIHYGWIGRATMIREWLLLDTASWYQTAGPDEAHDQAAIQIGIDLAKFRKGLCDLVSERIGQLSISGERDVSKCLPCSYVFTE